MGFFEFPHTRTYDTDLGWLIKTVTSYDEAIRSLNEWIEINTPKLEDLMAFKEALESGDLPEGVRQAIEDWCRDNLLDLVAQSLRNVYFGLTNDGYFCAFIPVSWSWVTFDTVMDGDDSLYGHLMLMYD